MIFANKTNYILFRYLSSVKPLRLPLEQVIGTAWGGQIALQMRRWG